MPTDDRATRRLFYIKLVPESIISQDWVLSIWDSIDFADVPEDMLIQKNAIYNEENIPGRSEPWLSYSHSAGTIINFTGKLVATGNNKELNWLESQGITAGAALGLAARFFAPVAPFLGIAGNIYNLAKEAPGMSVAARQKKIIEVIDTVYADVQKKVAWLEALCHAQYDSQGRAYPPPMCVIHFGENFERRGVIKMINFTYHPPWEVNTLMSYHVDCYITFQEVNVSPKSYAQVRRRQSPQYFLQPEPSVSEMIGKEALSMARSGLGI